MASHGHRHRSAGPALLRIVVAATLVAALVSAGALSLAQASPTVQPGAPPFAATGGQNVAVLFPDPVAPDLDLPDVPLPDPEPETSTTASDHCGDIGWWNARTEGDPSDYVSACGTWPSWIDRGEDTSCLPGERNCQGATPYTGPTDGRPWSPEYGYYEGRADGPTNSRGEPCLQGRDNNDPNC